MRTKIFFLIAMLASVATSAQSHINIEMLSATYTTSPAVKFRVSWSSVPTVAGQTHNAKVWVWIDFLKFNADNTTTGNTWTRAEISATPAVSSSPASTAALDASTNKGFWLNGITGSYSATVTATLTNIPVNTKFNWCAYVSDYPPNVTLDKGTYTFKGTTNFIVSNPAQILTTKTMAKTSLNVTASSTFTDATNCPGIGSLYCPYTGSDLYMDATHLCQQRASGAKNWEAWIKDTRDDELYRIVLMPDDKWWLAQNVKYAGAGYPVTGCSKDDCGRAYPLSTIRSSSSTGNVQGICPATWLLPVNSDWTTMLTSIGNTAAITLALRLENSTCGDNPNTYGFADKYGVCYNTTNIGDFTTYFSQWYSWTGTGHTKIQVGQQTMQCACNGNGYIFRDLCKSHF